MNKQKVNNVKNKTSTTKCLSLIFNILFYVLIVVAIIFIIFLYVGQTKNRLVSIFGYSVAVIQSGSMIDGGFNIGEKVIIKKVNIQELKKDDIIVFYKYSDPADVKLTTTEITDIIDSYVPPELSSDKQLEKDILNESRITQNEVIEKGEKLIFHRIIGIYVDEYGTKFFQTKGDSNNSADKVLIREDYVVAEYCDDVAGLTWFINFVSTPWGIIIFVLIPLAFLVFTQLMSLVDTINGNILVKKLLRKQISIDDKIFKKIDINEYLNEADKLFLYYSFPNEEKAKMFEFLWGYLKNSDLNDSQKEYVNKLYTSFDILKSNSKAFWGYWLTNCEDVTLKKNINIYAMASVIAEKEQVGFDKAYEKALKICKETKKK